MTRVNHYSVQDRKAEAVYHTVSDFLAECDRSRRSSYEGSWAGSDSYTDNRRLALDGWDEEVVLTDAVAAHVSDKVWTERTIAPTVTKRYDVSGGEVDIDRFLTGEPECLVELIPSQVAQAGRAVRLVIHNGVRAVITPEVYRGRGAAVVSLIDALQRAGHPLEIWVGSDAAFARSGQKFATGQRWSYIVKVQDAADPLDIGRIVYFASHPGAHRQLGFAVRTAPGNGIGNDPENVGGSHPLGPSCVPDDDHGTTIVLPQLTEHSRWDTDSAAAWVVEQLDKIGLGEPLSNT